MKLDEASMKAAENLFNVHPSKCVVISLWLLDLEIKQTKEVDYCKVKLTSKFIFQHQVIKHPSEAKYTRAIKYLFTYSLLHHFVVVAVVVIVSSPSTFLS